VKRAVEVVNLAGAQVLAGEPLVVGLKLPDVLVGDPGRSQECGEAFQDGAYLVLLPGGARFSLDYRRPLMGVVPDKALRFKPPERLANRSDADAKTIRKVTLP